MFFGEEGRQWSIEAGEYLRINIVKIHHKSGAITVYPE
jgi:hypothetical protein